MNSNDNSLTTCDFHDAAVLQGWSQVLVLGYTFVATWNAKYFSSAHVSINLFTGIIYLPYFGWSYI